MNGKEREIDGPLKVKELVESFGLPQKGVVVEVNREIVYPEEREEKTVNEGDRVEILRFVGGG